MLVGCFFCLECVCVLKLRIFLLFLFERDEYEKLHFFLIGGKDAGEHHILWKYILVIRHTQIKYIKYDFNISSETCLKNSELLTKLPWIDASKRPHPGSSPGSTCDLWFLVKFQAKEKSTSETKNRQGEHVFSQKSIQQNSRPLFFTPLVLHGRFIPCLSTMEPHTGSCDKDFLHVILMRWMQLIRPRSAYFERPFGPWKERSIAGKTCINGGNIWKNHHHYFWGPLLPFMIYFWQCFGRTESI